MSAPALKPAADGRAGLRARDWRCAPSARSGGFTLVEVLLATVLLAAGLALAFATLSAASQTATRGEDMARRGERMRAVEGFMYRRLTAARPVAFANNPAGAEGGEPQRFVGAPDRMRFVADLPDYLGQGGPYLHDFRIENEGEGVRVVLMLQLVLAGDTIDDGLARTPEVLVEDLDSARFRYRGLAEDGNLGGWQDEWEQGVQLPLLVEASFRDRGGREWPPLVVALPQAASGGGTFGANVR